jgi:hypothetical protein
MEVALYIKTPKFQNANAITLSSFMNRVSNDGGVFEAADCCMDIIESLGGAFDTLDTYNRIELFNDEKISVTSSVQNISDISKVFTDYSQSFTIPASKNNNEIFRHWYENSIDNAYDQRIRYPGYIEIDTQTFRSGRWQLEGATIKNNRVEDYKLTFYGELKSLMDKFGDEKLQDVKELNDYTVSYSGDLVQELVTTPLSASQTDVMFPLISSKRTWAAADPEAPTSSSYPIVYNELFPAIKLPLILNAFETRYGVNFNGAFLTDDRFTKAYLWLKNSEAETYTMTSAERRIEIQATENDGNFYANADDNTVTAVGFEDSGTFTVNVTSATAFDMTLTVYKDNVFFGSVQSVTDSISYTLGTQTGTGVFSFTIKKAYSASTPTFNYTYTANKFIVSNPIQPTDGLITTFSDSGSIVMNNLMDLAITAPDMKVSDFFSGMLKMFNLTAYSTDGVNFTLEQLENWYFLGKIKDFSGYTTTDFEYNRVKPYKKIDFKYQKNESILNRSFYDRNAREYGDLNYAFFNDGSDYTIQLPFENLLFTNWDNTITTTSLPQVGYAFKPDLKPFKPKGVILYFTGGQPFDVDWYFSDGVNTPISFNYANIFGADVNINRNQTNTINWGVEISTVYFVNVYSTLFANYYLAYLNNLYSLKSRLVKVKMRLPYLEMLNLKLNDRIVIRDKRYVINQYTTDLTTFETDMELIQDFRSINYNNSTIRTTDNSVQILRFNTTSVNPLIWTIESDPEGLITTLTNGDTYVDVQIKANVSGIERIASIVSNLDDRIIIVQDA